MEQYWKIGDLAAATGVTVRTLHHFDQIGLLRAADRSAAGHRHYTAADVRRLYQILALRQLGMPLGEIGRSLDGPAADLESAVRRQLAQVEQHLDAQQVLLRRLRALVRAFDRATEPSIDDLIATMEALMHGSYFTPDQLAQAKQRHREPGFGDRLAACQEQCAEIGTRLKQQLDNGVDPADPAVQELAHQWSAVMTDLVGDDRAMLSAIYSKIDGAGPELATHGALTAESWTYLRRAFAVGFGG